VASVTGHVDDLTAVMADNIILHTNQVINTVREQTDRVILFYSTGKDSTALVDLLAPHFKEVVCVFMYFVKDLEHINSYLNFTSAKYANVTILQVPHWILTSILKEGLYCIPNPKVRLMDLSAVDENIRIKTGITHSFYGMKQSDGLNRRLMLKTYKQEAINSKTNKVYPLSKWKNKDVLSYIRLNKLPCPISYSSNKASQGLGFNTDVFLYLRNNYPQDLQKILIAFPLSEQILFEHDYKERRRFTEAKV